MGILTGLVAKECQKKIITARIGGIWKRSRSQKRWTYQNEEDLKVMGIRNCHTVARDREE
jgi:hypothetical protein